MKNKLDIENFVIQWYKASMNVYVALPADVWKGLKAKGDGCGCGVTSYQFEGEDAFVSWLREQFARRSAATELPSRKIDPVYCHLSLRDARDWWATHRRAAVLTVRVDDQ